MSPKDAKETEANAGYLGDVESGCSSAPPMETSEVDPWAIVELVDDSPKWSGMRLFMLASYYIVSVIAHVFRLFKCFLLSKKRVVSSS
jgi:hypothetical protein